LRGNSLHIELNCGCENIFSLLSCAKTLAMDYRCCTTFACPWEYTYGAIILTTLESFSRVPGVYSSLASLKLLLRFNFGDWLALDDRLFAPPLISTV
jgi:hypothetical protein